MRKLTNLIPIFLILVGCGSNSTPGGDDSGNGDAGGGGEELKLSIETYLEVENWGITRFTDGYISKEGVEIFYGQSLFAYRVNGGEWTINNNEDIYVYGVEILSPQNWVRTIVRDIFEEDVAIYIEQTEDGGVTWNSALFDETNPVSEFVSALTYDYTNNQIYTAFNLGLAVSEVPIESFNVLESSGDAQGVAVKLLFNPIHDEIWWIGRLALGIGNPPTNDGHVRRFHLNNDGVTSEDLTQDIGLERTLGGLIYRDDPNVVFVAGSEGIRRTEDSGESWVNIFDDGEVANIVYSETTGSVYWATLSSRAVEVFCSSDLGYSFVSNLTEEIPEYGRISHIETNGTQLLVALDRHQTYSIYLDDIPCD